MAYIIIKNDEVIDFVTKFVITNEELCRKVVAETGIVGTTDLSDYDPEDLAYDGVRDLLEDGYFDVPFGVVDAGGYSSVDDDNDPWTRVTGGDGYEPLYFVVGEDQMPLEEIKHIAGSYLPDEFDYKSRMVDRFDDGIVPEVNRLGEHYWDSPWYTEA